MKNIAQEQQMALVIWFTSSSGGFTSVYVSDQSGSMRRPGYKQHLADIHISLTDWKLKLSHSLLSQGEILSGQVHTMQKKLVTNLLFAGFQHFTLILPELNHELVEQSLPLL